MALPTRHPLPNTRIFNIIFILAITCTVAFAQQPEGIPEGHRAPLFEARAQNGDTIRLANLLEKGPIVLFFYRGAWCPYCNRQMSDLQDSLEYITKAGASVIAITPATEDDIKSTIEKTESTFPIIHDKDYKIMYLYNTAFTLDSATVARYKHWNIDLEAANGNTDNVLPVPATYVIARDGTIRHVFFDTDYKKRASVQSILDEL